MTNTHTPGPWAVRAGENGKKTVIVPHVDGYSVIAERVESAAAPIIAAAPELLAALADAEFLLRKAGQLAGPMQDSFNRSAADARAAIAKAEGRE